MICSPSAYKKPFLGIISLSLSLSLICPLCLNLVPSLFLAQTHVTHAYAHTHTHTHISRDLDATSRSWIPACNHQPTVAACERTLLLFYEFQWPSSQRLSLEMIRKGHPLQFLLRICSCTHLQYMKSKTCVSLKSYFGANYFF